MAMDIVDEDLEGQGIDKSHASDYINLHKSVMEEVPVNG